MQHVQTFPDVERAWTRPSSDSRQADARVVRGRRWPHGVAAIAAASGLSLLFPLAALVIGAPLALALRGIVELTQWVVSLL